MRLHRPPLTRSVRRSSGPARNPDVRSGAGAAAGVASQGGFALMLVLGVIALTSLVIVALLGLTLTSARITASQAQSARERRAADGALESAIGQIARSSANNACDAVPVGNELSFDERPEVAGSAISVSAGCELVPVGDPSDGSSDPLGGSKVDVVGESYDGPITAPGGLAGSPTLVHTGHEALAFRADVDVRHGAAARSTNPAGPGITATGQYAQGDPASGFPACGPLTPGAGQPSVEIADRDDAPSCNDARARAIAPRTGSLFAPGEAVGDGTVPACSSLVELDPGRYDAVDTAKLNRLLGGGCAGATFWFHPGKYLFDVNDPANPEPDRHALVIADASVRVIFGEPTGSPGAAEFPRACDATASGASIQLTGRSAIRHRAGRVAICPAFNAGTGTPLPALVQSDLAPSQPLLRSSSPALPISLDVRTCNPNCSFSTEWTSTGNAPLTSAELQFRSLETPPVHQGERAVNVQVSGPVSCSTGFLPSGRTNDLYTTIDLMAFGSCAGALAGEDESIFEGATITVTHRYTSPDGLCGPFDDCIGLRVNDVRLRTNVQVSQGTSVSTSSWQNPGAALALDGVRTVANHGDECFLLPGDVRCRLDRPRSHTLSINGFNPTTGGTLRASDHVETLGVRFNTPAGDTWPSWAAVPADRPQPSMRIELRLASGATCSVTHDGYSRSRVGIHVDLISPSSSCRALVDDVGDLVGAGVTVSMQTGCAWFGSAHIYDPFDISRCFMARLPDIDRLALAVTTDTVRSSPRSEMTVDHDRGTSFNVQGDTLMPRADVDLHWKGSVNILPIFGGYLSVKGLGSDMAPGAQMGVVCCSPPSTVKLTAVIEGRVIAETHVVVGRPSSSTPGGAAARPLAVLDWRFCGGGCPSVLGTTTTSVPPPPGGG